VFVIYILRKCTYICLAFCGIVWGSSTTEVAARQINQRTVVRDPVKGMRVLETLPCSHQKLLRQACSKLGCRYLFGAASGNGRVFDCSSFVQWLFRQHGIKLPRTAREQVSKGRRISVNDLKCGDLCFFYNSATKRGTIGHVGLYIGEGLLVHAHSRYGVCIEPLSNKWLRSHLGLCRRIII
jgi:hypothetical protein